MQREGLAAANRVDDFDLIAFAQRSAFVLAARHDVEVQFDGYPATGKVEPVQQGRNVLAIWQFEGFTVQLNAHAHGHHYF